MFARDYQMAISRREKFDEALSSLNWELILRKWMQVLFA